MPRGAGSASPAIRTTNCCHSQAKTNAASRSAGGMKAIFDDDAAASQYVIQIGVNTSHKAKAIQPMVRSVLGAEIQDAGVVHA